MPGVEGDHARSKFQLLLGGSSVMIEPLSISQQIVRLSLPALSIRDGSRVHQAKDRTPLVCADNSCSGDMLFRRSQSCSVVERSSSDATTNWVAMLGFHCRAEQRRRLCGSEKLITGFCFFRSHTTVEPAPLVDARICCTLLFHARWVISPEGWLGPVPFREGYNDGWVGSSKSQMQSSPSAAPEANRLALKGLNINPRTDP
mmetsp:Transcript_24380/g.43411  ORF Transcript_24380/g.43411 Transcript_24380/m.43411 type:complete len:202 (+) Transcript_24380:2555-3160(+)